VGAVDGIICISVGAGNQTTARRYTHTADEPREMGATPGRYGEFGYDPDIRSWR
jgi:hypothetical protein